MATQQFVVITENDVSQWADETGSRYHFPKRYRKYLQPGVTIVYYKGKLGGPEFKQHRLSNKPHYFGFASVGGEPYPDENSAKGDLFVAIRNFTPFETPVFLKDPSTGDYIEEIPKNLAKNYWFYGVRPISEEVFAHIARLSGLDGPAENAELGDEYTFTSTSEEGGKTKVYSTRYERDQKLRKQAIKIHKPICKACGFDFKAFYGEHGEDFIHIHHVRPISQFNGKQTVNPETDLMPLCANCHAMVHRKPKKTLSIEELKQMISAAGNSQ